jgi:hypothetical protein
MKISDIITDDVVDTYAFRFLGWEHDDKQSADWDAIKKLMVATAIITSTALGIVLEESLMNDDGTWQQDE